MFDNQFLAALIGGGLIGLSALLLMLYSGKVAGCSGILTQSFVTKGDDRHWRIAFIFGLVIGPTLTSMVGVTLPTLPDFSLFHYVIGGLLVGTGAALANGCTSGHGICGIGRLSKRSIVATLTFMTTAMVTVFTVRHLIE